MEIVVEILTRVPEGWPRLLVVGLIVLVLAVIGAPQLLFGQKREERYLARAQNLLNVRKLQLDVDRLKADDADAAARGAGLDATVDTLIRQDAAAHASAAPHARSTPPAPSV